MTLSKPFPLFPKGGQPRRRSRCRPAPARGRHGAPRGATVADGARPRLRRVDGMKRLTPSSMWGACTAPPRERAHGHTRRGPAMDYVGIDLHKKESQICLLTETGEVMERRIRTEPQRFAEVLGGRPRARILVEASTESEWVARCLEALGHEVVVADPNLAPMYATRTRKVKTDSAGRPSSARGLSARRVSPRAPAVRRAAACARPPGRARCRGPGTHRIHRPDSGPGAAARLERAHWECGHLL
jgi:hypothetical protein